MVLVLHALHIYTLIEFLVGLDQSNVYADIQKIEGLIRCCLPLAQKLYNVPKGFIKEEVEQYFPGFLAFVDCTEQQRYQDLKTGKRRQYYSDKKKKHTLSQESVCSKRN